MREYYSERVILCERCKKETRHHMEQYLVRKYDLGYEVDINRWGWVCDVCGSVGVSCQDLDTIIHSSNSQC